MRTHLKVILAAMGIAVLTSPVMAGTLQNTRAQGDERAPGATATGVHSTVKDCVHVPFPQCSGGNWRRARRIHKQRAMHRAHGDHPL
jgi:hypothetical protein